MTPVQSSTLILDAKGIKNTVFMYRVSFARRRDEVDLSAPAAEKQLEERVVSSETSLGTAPRKDEFVADKTIGHSGRATDKRYAV